MTVCSYRDCRHRRWSAKLFFVSLVLHEHIGNTHFFFLLFFCHEISTMTVVCPSSKPEWTFRLIVWIPLVTEPFLKAAEKTLRTTVSLYWQEKCSLLMLFTIMCSMCWETGYFLPLRYWVWQIVVISHFVWVKETASISAAGDWTV